MSTSFSKQSSRHGPGLKQGTETDKKTFSCGGFNLEKSRDNKYNKCDHYYGKNKQGKGSTILNQMVRVDFSKTVMLEQKFEGKEGMTLTDTWSMHSLVRGKQPIQMPSSVRNNHEEARVGTAECEQERVNGG